MSISAWANAARQDKYRQAPEHQRAIDTIALLLERKSDPQRAASTIASIYDPLLKCGPATSLIPTLWDIFCDAVREFGGDRDMASLQVGLINSISKLPDVRDEHGSVVAPVNGVYWRDLPEFAITFREYGIDVEPIDQVDQEGGDWNSQTAPLLNATTFGATYLTHGVQSIGMPFHAEVGLKQGIEVLYETPEQRQRAIMYVPPAATWILIAGDVIFGLCKNDHGRTTVEPGFSKPSSEWLWTGRDWGFSLERWAFWKKRFGEIALTQELKDSIKDIAARASGEMERIEG